LGRDEGFYLSTMRLLVGTVTMLATLAIGGAVAAQNSTSEFLQSCLQTASCEHQIYLLLDGDPILDGQYSCLLQNETHPLPHRLLKWLEAHKVQSKGDILEDLHSGLEALRVENLGGFC
jgi:hypothetical protein